MKKWLAIIGFVLVVVVMLVGFALSQLESQPKPQQTTAPSSEITRTPSPTFTVIPSETPTRYPSSTPTASYTPTVTNTATLATRVIQLTVIMPDVTLPPSATPLPTNLIILPAAPEPLEPLPNATFLPYPYTDFTDWVSYESDHPLVQYTVGIWTPILSQQASEGQYHYSEEPGAQVRFAFKGEGVRVRYVGFTNGGRWQVVIDGEVVDTIDAYSPLGKFTGTEVYTVGAGEHILELHNLEEANPASTGHLIALDAIQVYRPDALTMIFPDGVYPSDTPTATLIPAEKIELIAAPPSPRPTSTERPPQWVKVALVIGYDENANQTLDVSEGVRGVSVRLVEIGTNRVIAQTFTDEQGFAQFEMVTEAAVQVVVPYFGEAWRVQPRGDEVQTFSLLLSPGNQPGLIP